MAYETLLTEQNGAVGIIRLNRPEALNALNSKVLREITAALEAWSCDDGVRCVILTGSERAFAAGADIKEMADKTYSEAMVEDFFAGWDRVTSFRKPILAAVSGFALGGGCELAMMCDFIIASDTAKFGQPEIKLGVMPGMGGSQRLTRAVGKAKAMDMCLTGRMMDAAEAERSGLVARVVAAADLQAEALQAAQSIAAFSLPSLMACKEAVNVAFEASLAEGVRFERRSFHGLFATADQKEGMAAFVAKRPPAFTHR
ncbi:MAG: enoyl-CoA hydratase [Hyphomonadaceae bacterium]|nr:enoyl-CoA hydratase [Hyphomonadaceae bacterium]